MAKGPSPQPWQVAASATQPPGHKAAPAPVSPGQLRQAENATTPPPAPPAPITPPNIPTDPKGFQTYLNQLGAKPPLKVDGIIGPKTLAAAHALNIAVPDELAPQPAAQPAPAPAPAPAQQQQQQQVDTPPPTPLTPAQIQDEVKARYGYLGALLDHPDVAAALTDAVANQLSDAQALARLYDTPTWRTSSAAQRNWEALTPGDQQAQVDQQKTSIAAQAKQLGVKIADDRLNQIASDAARLGWNAAQINNAVAAEFRYQPGGQTGQIGQAEASIRADAQRYNVADLLGDSTMASFDAQIAAGTLTPEQAREQIVTLAQQRFPGLAAQITVTNPTQNALAPYAQIASQELGLNPDTIDFRDPKWNVMVNQIDDKGNHAPMSLYDAQRLLRSDPTYHWDETVNGKTAYAQAGVALAQALGVHP